MTTHVRTDRYRGMIKLGPNSVLVARTCIACGVFLSAKHYAKAYKKVKGKLYLHINLTCNTCLIRNQRTKFPERMKVTASNYNKSTWTKTIDTATKWGKNYTLNDLDLIVEGIESGFTYEEIGILIGRTTGSVNSAVHRFGLSKGWPTREIWSVRFSK